MPISYIQRTRERYAKFPPYGWSHHTDAPWAPLTRPINSCRVALLSSGGFYLPEQPPFGENRSWEDTDWGPNFEPYGVGSSMQDGFTERVLRRAGRAPA